LLFPGHVSNIAFSSSAEHYSDRLQNDVNCVRFGIKLYSLAHPLPGQGGKITVLSILHCLVFFYITVAAKPA